MDVLTIVGKYLGTGLSAVAAAFVALVLVVTCLIALPGLLPNDAGGFVLYVVLGALLFSPVFPVAALGLLGVTAYRLWRHHRPSRRRQSPPTGGESAK